jgi:uncharacterized BrkB/YihY/UPF0761 family membrane protein
MIRLSLFQNLWLLMALLGAVALLLAVVLGYLALWQKRQAGGEAPSRRLNALRHVPWVLLVLYAAAACYSLAYVIVRGLHPPNW